MRGGSEYNNNDVITLQLRSSCLPYNRALYTDVCLQPGARAQCILVHVGTARTAV